MAVVVVALLGATEAEAQRPRMNAEGMLRVGLYDPHPRICTGAELTQRDLRVMRMAYGIHRDPASRAAPPWYFERLKTDGGGAAAGGAESEAGGGAAKKAAVREGAAAPGGVQRNGDGESSEPGPITLRLRTNALWDRPAEWLIAPGGPADPLAGWKGRIARALAPMPFEPGDSFLDIRLQPDPARPFLWTRLHGSALVPRVQGWDTSLLGEDCPAWPAGVWLLPQEGDLRYTLAVNRRGGAAFTISAYRRDSALWGDFRRGRLDAVLVEGGDLPSASLSGQGDLVWGVEPGTQQIVLLPSPKLREELGREHWAALSQALAREELGTLLGEGRIAPPRGFLGPLLRKRPPEPPPALASNPRDARRAWLTDTPERTRLELATVAHPQLQALARRIGEQWQRTLNLRSTVAAVPLDAFAASLESWRYDLYLTVADLDDGSLQDLWERHLPPEPEAADPHALTEKRIAGWEAALLKELPYLPIAENLHWVVARDSATIRALCPACIAPAPPPGRGAAPGGPGSDDYVPPEG